MVCVLVALDLALTNIAVALLAVAIQQCLVALNPAFTVTIESIVRKKLAHPAVYLVILMLCCGPIVAQVRRAARCKAVGARVSLTAFPLVRSAPMPRT